MSPQGGDTVGTQLQRALDLLHRLYLDVEAADAEIGGRAAEVSTPAGRELPEASSYNPNASMRDTPQRQAMVDATFETDRGPVPGSRPAAG